MPDSEGHPDFDELELGAVLTALADPIRRQVVAVLAGEPDGTERPCSSFGLPLTKSTLTYHFRLLRESGLVRQVNRGNSRMAQLRRADLEARFPGLLALVVAETQQAGKGAPSVAGNTARAPH
ncbi:helix-turn-helix transcriptional regulator [Actinoplanes sp. NEAU-A12]|uniref:Helix-turn-helix transcriptional regulator n=1 Tax=Actinoplanes sandaracinus TaxID=3045177 RepID=A0ABT6X0C2_9ACTN|nr:helix-turn-helix transcriptional regulator [Actinoplanes sandaracinus]MDI6105460.1 helix-turn-helix transcriptional regulator [Actinoplanes sandaracinus]